MIFFSKPLREGRRDKGVRGEGGGGGMPPVHPLDMTLTQIYVAMFKLPNEWFVMYICMGIHIDINI